MATVPFTPYSVQHTQLVAGGLVILPARCSKESAPMRPSGQPLTKSSTAARPSTILPKGTQPPTLHREQNIPLLPYQVTWSLVNELDIMSDRSRSFYASVPFKFIVDGEPFYIHADLVSFHSKPLDRMINGHMAEAQKGFATLEDVDTGTFVRFIEWAHRGYYTAAGFTTVEYRSPCASSSLSHHEKTPAPEEEYNDEVPLATQDEWDLQPSVVEADWLSAPDPPVFGTKKDKKKGMRTSWEMPNDQPKKYRAPKAREELKEAFISRRYTFRQGVLEIPPPRPNQGPEENYTDVFLSHAQLYVFADKYDVQALKVLALEELYATLAIYTLHPARTGDIITLLQYIYGNTGQSDGGEEDLRQILKTYIGYEMDTLINDGDFRDLMIVDGGSLLGDFITMVGQRISIPA